MVAHDVVKVTLGVVKVPVHVVQLFPVDAEEVKITFPPLVQTLFDTALEEILGVGGSAVIVTVNGIELLEQPVTLSVTLT